MIKKVIALRGVANVGKTDTIKKVLNILSIKYKSASKEYEILKADVRVVVTINGIKIGIESQGDPGSRLEESLSLFVRVGCQIIICATRTRGQTVNAVNKLKNNYEINWLEKKFQPNASERDESNLNMAKKIVQELEKII